MCRRRYGLLAFAGGSERSITVQRPVVCVGHTPGDDSKLWAKWIRMSLVGLDHHLVVITISFIT